jgi:hypothetical protein
MLKKYCYQLASLIFATLLSSISPANDDEQYAFVQLGKLQLSDNESNIEFNGEKLTGKYSDLPFFAGGIQTFKYGNFLRFGYEAGAVLSWHNDSVKYSGTTGGSGTEVSIKIDNELILFGTMLGALADINMNDHVRLFTSTGPMLLVASIDQYSEDIESLPDRAVSVNGKVRDYGFGYGWYGSAGLIISPDKYSEIGLVLRSQNVNLNFSSDIADVSYDGQQIMLSFGYKI